jgi:hypothetical protein
LCFESSKVLASWFYHRLQKKSFSSIILCGVVQYCVYYFVRCVVDTDTIRKATTDGKAKITKRLPAKQLIPSNLNNLHCFSFVQQIEIASTIARSKNKQKGNDQRSPHGATILKTSHIQIASDHYSIILFYH